MKTKGTKIVKLSDITTNLFVRQKLDEEHVLYLAELMKNGVEMRDPIEVTEENGVIEMVNGRHRRTAYELADILEVKVRVLEFDSQVEKVAYAFNVNKGSKPPTAEDTQHTIEEMDKLGASLKKISEMLSLPVKMVQKWVADVKAETKRRNLCKAEELVLDHKYTLADAAKEAGIEWEDLKTFMGRNKKRRTRIVNVKEGIKPIFRSVGQRLGKATDKVFSQFEVGDLSKAQVEDVLHQMEVSIGRLSKALNERRARFNAKVNGVTIEDEKKKSA